MVWIQPYVSIKPYGGSESLIIVILYTIIYPVIYYNIYFIAPKPTGEVSRVNIRRAIFLTTAKL